MPGSAPRVCAGPPVPVSVMLPALLLSSLLTSAPRAAEPVPLCARAQDWGWRVSTEGVLLPPQHLQRPTQLDFVSQRNIRRLLRALDSRGIELVAVVLPTIPPFPFGCAADDIQSCSDETRPSQHKDDVAAGVSRILQPLAPEDEVQVQLSQLQEMLKAARQVEKEVSACLA